ncbi:MAG TPA: efflux RND transporter periplasmic adaptor subunit [Longimicrobiales bacterium]|nr:efflux RND transporter periplasmic adaptor subunit [Longimicrobiales bacterium]
MTAPRASRVVRIGAVVVVLVVAALVVRGFVAPMEVDTVGVQERDIVRTLAVVGRVRAPARAALGASVAGTVTEVHVREGDRVAAGDVLVSLDDREARAAVGQAEAALAETTALSRDAVAQAEREAELADRDLERLRAVFDQGGLTRQRVEQAEQRAADARSRLESLRVRMVGGVESGELASVARARATLEAARARLALTRVTAPAQGVILTRTVEPGDAAQPGRVMLEMAFSGPMELVVFPAEQNLGQLEVGAPASASADAFPDRIFNGTVSHIAPSIDPSQGTVEVRVAVPSPPEYLRPEMTVSVNVEAGRRAGAAVLPERAVQGLGTGDPWVGIIRSGRLERQPVEVGLVAGDQIEILSGVAAGESVVLMEDAGDAVGRRMRARPEGEAAPAPGE